MQFLEKLEKKAEHALNKVDKLASDKIAVLRPAEDEDVLAFERDPSSVGSSDAIASLAAKLGTWDASERAELDAVLNDLRASEKARD